MPTRIRNHKDFWAGLIFLAVGLLAFGLGADYDRGSDGSMGPGYFPAALSVLLALIGVASMLRSLAGPPVRVDGWALRNGCLVLASVVLFAALLRGAGLIVAVLVLTLVSGSAHRRFHAGRYLLLALVMAGFSVLVFVKGLGLPIPAIGPWLGF
ncbi:tripartite tricarboxylate transporter TctB family protein [Hydrogenophaga sp.]|uniref:tripartite tricarboxylate transporter TctB family protein n=1 Tax=Hydrogenophaga sp. TaxID=1904254 RepID=UPI00286D9084|nr:tripartite tricarboxylate transporter TctB family protein [Hydrogenophaga sp.]